MYNMTAALFVLKDFPRADICGGALGISYRTYFVKTAVYFDAEEAAAGNKKTA